MNADVDHESPSSDLSTWTIERLQLFAEGAHGGELEAVRVVAQGHAYGADETREIRKQWAKLSLQVNQRLRGDGPWEHARVAQHDFMLRAWVIDQLGPDDGDHDWSPEALASDTLAALALIPAEARALGDHWRDLEVEEMGELRRHKNLTAHLDGLVDDLEPGPVRDQLLAWTETRRHLP